MATLPPSSPEGMISLSLPSPPITPQAPITPNLPSGIILPASSSSSDSTTPQVHHSKQFILVIDAGSNLQSHFNEIVNTYLLRIIGGYFLDSQKENQSGSTGSTLDVALVIFRDYVPYSEFLIRSTSFTNDFREFRLWMQNVAHNFGESSSPLNTRPIVEALCAATKISKIKDAKEKHIILVTNSEPSEANCRSCPLFGDCYAHANRLAKASTLLSVISPRQSDSLTRIFQAGKPEEDVPIFNKNYGSHMLLLRGLNMTAHAAPTPGNSGTIPIGMPNSSEPKAPPATSPVQIIKSPSVGPAVAAAPSSNPKALWEGVLQWQHNSNTVTQQCELVALPTAMRPEADLSVYGTSEWPSNLVISGVCNAKDQHIAQHFKAAKFLEFWPSRKDPNIENQYKSFYMQLMQKSWAAVVYLPNRTLMILPHKESNKLLGLVLPKIALTPRPNAPVAVAPPVKATNQPNLSNQGSMNLMDPKMNQQIYNNAPAPMGTMYNTPQNYQNNPAFRGQYTNNPGAPL